MKTLIFIKHPQQEKIIAHLKEQGNNFLLHQETGNASELEKLQIAAKFAETEQCDLLIDIQSDTTAEHIECLLTAMTDASTPTELLIASSKPGKQAKNVNSALLMLQLLTGEKIYGFRNKLRIYPIKLLTHIPDSFYENELFYTRILIHAARTGYKINNIEIPNYTPSSFLEIPRKRFFTLELLKALRPWPTKRLCERNFHKEKFKEFLCHPLKFLKFLLQENASPGGLAAAAATGMFLGTLPLFFFHTAAIIYVSIKLRLNKMLSVNISHLCMPPFLPFACIEIGYYMRNGKWLTTATFDTIVKELHLRLLDWLLGSLILAPLNAIIFALITYIIAISLRAALKKKEKLSN